MKRESVQPDHYKSIASKITAQIKQKNNYLGELAELEKELVRNDDESLIQS
mgnify:CR=1 FL=1